MDRLLPPGGPVPIAELVSDLQLGAPAPADRPLVISNFVMSADGKATVDGRSGPLGGEADREMFHRLRTQVDAVLAGTGTLRVERYGRLVRDPELRRARAAEGLGPDPLALVISRSLDVPFDIPLFAEPEQPVALYTESDGSVPDLAARVEVMRLARATPLEVLRSARRELGVRSVLCEGGPALFSSLLAADLVDECFLTVAPLLAGGSELGVATGGASTPRGLSLVWAVHAEGCVFLRYRRRTPE